MSTTSASPSSTYRQRTRNAQAQADLRVRRKAYIKTLEETVSSLEACVRQLRASNSNVYANASVSAPTLSEASCSRCEELRKENARLRAVIDAANLTAVASVQGAQPPRGASKSTKKRPKAKNGQMQQEKNWSTTSSITTKKRTLSEMHAFALHVDSQLGDVNQRTHAWQECSQQQLQHPPSERTNPAVFMDNVSSLHDYAIDQRVTSSSSTTPLSSSRSSVVEQHSPQTPRSNRPLSSFECDLKMDVIDAMPVETCSTTTAAVAASNWPSYAGPIVLAPVSNAMPTPTVFAENTPTPLVAQSLQQPDLISWLVEHHVESNNCSLWHQHPTTSSASIRDFHRSTMSVRLARCSRHSPPRLLLRRTA